MKYSYFLIVVFLSCNSVENNNQDTNKLNSQTEWKTYFNKKYLPKALIDTLNTKLNFDEPKFKLANPNEDYTATDVIDDENLPTRKLEFIANKNEKWILAYIHGGFGSHIHYIEFDLLQEKIDNLKIGTTLDDIKNVVQADSLIKVGKIQFQNFDF